MSNCNLLFTFKQKDDFYSTNCTVGPTGVPGQPMHASNTDPAIATNLQPMMPYTGPVAYPSMPLTIPAMSAYPNEPSKLN